MLADQIAAGEVVERPASVVKELIENAIDAGAKSMSVEIEDGGLRAIRVSDDGSGMSKEDAQLCYLRHATSKLRTRDDLFCIRTMGFRGEALPSIASVSHFALRTRPRDDLAGTEVRVEGGVVRDVREVGCAPGTHVEIADLFYNVPARLKFLKSKPTESGHVSAVCTRAALAHPGLAFKLTRDNRTTLEFAPARSLSERVNAVFPGEALREYKIDSEGATLHALLGAPERARSGSAHLHIFVNTRPVRDLTLARSVAFAFGSVLPPGRFPVGALHITLDPAEVDVNVHPQKSEVRFARGRALLDAITRNLARSLGTSAFRGPAARSQNFWSERLGSSGAGLIATSLPDAALAHAVLGASAGAAGAASGAAPYANAAALESEPDPWGLSGQSETSAPTAIDANAATTQASAAYPPRVAEELAPGPSQSQTAQPAPLLEPTGFFGGLRLLGQSRRTFLVCESDSGVVIIDQHAADERVRFDQLRRAYAQHNVRVQRLLFPERVECSEVEATLIEQHQTELEALGLACSRLGPTTVAVASVPALLSRASPVRLVRDVLSELSRTGERAFQDALDMALATMACHAAIRAGDPLSEVEVSALFKQLDAVEDFQRHCPHGRPILCVLPFTELEHRLGR